MPDRNAPPASPFDGSFAAPLAASFSEIFGPLMDSNQLHPFDQDLARALWPIVDFIDFYHRGEVTGLGNIPSGPALLVGNHNGGITFMEPFLLGRAWHLRTHGTDDFYYLGHDTLLRLPVLANLLMKLGATRASHDTAAQAFARGRKVAVWPGGNLEAFRPWKERYKVDFYGHSGFVRLALRHGVPIVPVLSFGGHDTFFIVRRGERLARWTGARRFLRTESWPVFVGLPWGVGVGPLFHLPLPVKLSVDVGEPISLDGYAADQAEDPAVVRSIYEVVLATLQGMMDQRVARRRTDAG